MTRTMRKGQSSALMLLVLAAPVVAGPALLPEAIAEPTQIIPFDTDEDSDVDVQDFTVLGSCLSGPMSPHDGTGMCYEVDNDLDGHIDLRDYAALQLCFSGPESLADPACAYFPSAIEASEVLADAGYGCIDAAHVLADFGFSALNIAEALKIVFNLDAEDYACEGGPWDSDYCPPEDSLSCTDTSPVCVYGGPGGVGVCFGGPIDGQPCLAAEDCYDIHVCRKVGGGAAQVLTNLGFSSVEVAEVLAFVYSMDTRYVADFLHGQGMDVDAIRATLRNLGYSEQKIFEATVEFLALKFGPQLRFDSGGHLCSQANSFPWSAQVYYALLIRDNYCACPRYAFGNQGYDPMPTYWKAFRCGNQVRIMYWWFYGYQFDCDCISGEHHADWEQVMVSLNEDALGKIKLYAVTFWAHGAWGTRWAGNFGYAQHILLWGGTHPIVYVGRTQHASYFSRQAAVQTCLFWHDKHDGDGFWLNPGQDSWYPLIRLQPSVSGGEEWMDADIAGGWCWGCDEDDNWCAHICAHPTQDSNYWCLMSGCDGSNYCSESDVASGWPIPHAP